MYRMRSRQTAPRRRRRDRRGSALVLVLVLTVALASLALSAIYLSFTGSTLSRSYEREQDFRYAAEAALAIGKSRINNDPYALPDTGYVQLIANGTITGADGTPIPGVQVNVYLGPSGSSTGQYGRFASVVAEAHDQTGARYVRRLELTQESFAKFAYWTDRESNNGNIIYFNNGDVLFGPVWTNDDIHIGSGGATFHDEVGTAGVIVGKQYGTFKKGYQERAKRIELPDNRVLGKLAGYAASGQFSFNAPNNGDETAVSMRIEFVPVDLDDPDSVPKGADEGFFRVYVANSGQQSWLRGDYRSENCGDWHWVPAHGQWEFFPGAVHRTSNNGLFAMLTSPAGENLSSSQARSELNRGSNLDVIMQGPPVGNNRPAGAPPRPSPRCYLGGDPHLVGVERGAGSGYSSSSSAWQVGGTDTTFTATGARGRWLPWSGTVPAALRAVRPDANYLFPLYRGFNPGSQGVVYVNGTVAVSGTLRGRITLYATANVVIPDNLVYETNPNPALGICADMLGIIAGRNVVVADNGLNTPVNLSGWKVFGSAPGITIQSVMMTLNSSFTVEDYDQSPTNAIKCESSWSGRGCLYLTGGVIQQARGAVGTSAVTGYIKRYTYDRCALINPPPFFPTTGRFMDNRYYEVDPSGFSVADLFQKIKPKT
jgi:hypothetical protein